MAGGRGRRRSARSRGARAVTAGSGIAVAATLLSGSIGEAATQAKVTVTSLSDTSSPSASNVVNGKAPTLADAIAYIDTKSGGGTITFASKLSGAIDLTSKLPTITKPAVISGPGANKLTVHNSVSKQPVIRVGSNTVITGVKLTGGQAGAIVSNAPLAVEDVVITGNSSPYGGGGVYAYNSYVLVADSVLTGNTVTDHAGGGLYEFGNGTVIVLGSTISDNHAPYGGGIATAGSGATVIEGSTISGNHASHQDGGLAFSTVSTVGGAHVSIDNSTIAHNVSAGRFGGVYIGHSKQDGAVTATVLGSTITDNVAKNGPGGGLADVFAKVNLDDSILAANRASATGTKASPDLAIRGTGPAHRVTAKFSLIGDGSQTIAKSLITNGTDLVGTATRRIRPKLKPLAHHGGLTKTMVPRRGSPALGVGNAGIFKSTVSGFPFVIDQRGGLRLGLGYGPKISDGTDIGAVEVTQVTQVKGFRKGDQHFSVITAAKRLKLDPSRKLQVTYGSQKIRYRSPELHFKRIKLSISGARSVHTYTHPNGTVKLSLSSLTPGRHVLKAAVSFNYRSFGQTRHFTKKLRLVIHIS